MKKEAAKRQSPALRAPGPAAAETETGVETEAETEAETVPFRPVTKKTQKKSKVHPEVKKPPRPQLTNRNRKQTSKTSNKA